MLHRSGAPVLRPGGAETSSADRPPVARSRRSGETAKGDQAFETACCARLSVRRVIQVMSASTPMSQAHSLSWGQAVGRISKCESDGSKGRSPRDLTLRFSRVAEHSGVVWAATACYAAPSHERFAKKLTACARAWAIMADSKPCRQNRYPKSSPNAVFRPITNATTATSMEPSRSDAAGR